MQVRREAFEPAHRLSILVRPAPLRNGRRCPRRSPRLGDAPHPTPGPPIATAASTLSSAFDSSYPPPFSFSLEDGPARPGCDRFKKSLQRGRTAVLRDNNPPPCQGSPTPEPRC